MNEDQVRSRMDEVLALLAQDVSQLRTGRATPSLVEGIVVAAYGGSQRLKIMELATIAVLDTQTLTIDPWDKSVIGEIKKAIEAANIGMNPNIDGEIIRISMPALTAEDREKYVKLLGVKLENAKIAIRQVRGDAMKDIKNSFEAKKITEDEKFAEEKRLQEATDEYIGKIDERGRIKEAELRTL